MCRYLKGSQLMWMTFLNLNDNLNAAADDDILFYHIWEWQPFLSSDLKQGNEYSI